MAGDSRLGVVMGANGGLRLLCSLSSRYLIGGLMIPPHSKKASQSKKSCTHSMNPTINSPTDSTTNLQPASSPNQIHAPDNAVLGRNHESNSSKLEDGQNPRNDGRWISRLLLPPLTNSLHH
uniref:Uncharacterized protein n=1 Tax=Arundo donax TaxID=35708 RepID=A0A0A9F0Z6_ARUDO